MAPLTRRHASVRVKRCASTTGIYFMHLGNGHERAREAR